MPHPTYFCTSKLDWEPGLQVDLDLELHGWKVGAWQEDLDLGLHGWQ